jgi:hypothetical protein
MNTGTVRQLSLVVVALVLLTPQDAWAYIDPGVGSYVFQLAMAAVLAAMYTLRRYSHGVRAFFRSLFRRG